MYVEKSLWRSGLVNAYSTFRHFVGITFRSQGAKASDKFNCQILHKKTIVECSLHRKSQSISKGEFCFRWSSHFKICFTLWYMKEVRLSTHIRKFLVSTAKCFATRKMLTENIMEKVEASVSEKFVFGRLGYVKTCGLFCSLRNTWLEMCEEKTFFFCVTFHQKNCWLRFWWKQSTQKVLGQLISKTELCDFLKHSLAISFNQVSLEGTQVSNLTARSFTSCKFFIHT